MNGVRRKVVPNRIFTERFGLKRRILNSQTDPSCEVQHLSVKFRIPAAEHHRKIQSRDVRNPNYYPTSTSRRAAVVEDLKYQYK